MNDALRFLQVERSIAENIESFKCDPYSSNCCEECLIPVIRILKCGKCKDVTYCGKECQIISWRAGHKLSCGNVTIRPIEGKGLGVVASRDLEMGDLITSEKAMLSFSSVNELNDGLIALTDSQKRKVMSLHDFVNGDDKTLKGIILSNCLLGARNYHLLYYKLSRFNHSCVPNIRIDTTSTDPFIKPTPLIAMKDINKGEELCWCYIAASGMYQNRKTRRATLKNDFGILNCECEACGLTGDAQLESDKNRLKLKDTETQLSTTLNPCAVPLLVQEKHQLLQKEGLDTANNLMNISRDLMLATWNNTDIIKYKMEGLSYAKILRDEEMINYFNTYEAIGF